MKMFRHILFATDGSAASEHAAGLAVGLARNHGSRLTALYVIDPYPYLNVGEASPVGFQAYMSAACEHAAHAREQVARLCSQGESPVELHFRRLEDVSASEGILRSAKDEDADLIVVGSHGRSGVARIMLGSIAAKVVAQSSIPVLVAR
jgi:nucleotide-binding universal stress UspA family protein